MSRHPNFFGEIIMWVGLYVAAFNALEGWEHLTASTMIFPFMITVMVSEYSTILIPRVFLLCCYKELRPSSQNSEGHPPLAPTPHQPTALTTITQPSNHLTSEIGG